MLRRLGLDPWDVARMNEPLAEELDLAQLPPERGPWLEVMAANPLLIQRPLITANDGTTVIGRSEEAVRQALRASTPS